MTGLVNTAKNSVGCQWLAGGGILGPHFSFTWFRGSPIGRERKTEELSRTSVEDINIEGHDGFIAVGDGSRRWATTCARSASSSTTTSSSGRSASPQKPFPDAVRRGQGTDPPVDCEREMSAPVRQLGRRVPSSALPALAVITGCCTRRSTGTAAKAGRRRRARATTTPSRQYPNLLKECDVLTTDILAKTVGADPLDIQSTFVGAVCRWQAANPAGLIDITRFWFEQGSLDNETQGRRAR